MSFVYMLVILFSLADGSEATITQCYPTAAAAETASQEIATAPDVISTEYGLIQAGFCRNQEFAL